jgi:alpha-glucan,water dikinase
LQPGNNAWILPANRPEGSYDEHGAIQSPFRKTGDTASVTVDFPDFSLNIVEFVLVDKNRNHWYKLNGQNFRIDIPQLNLSGFSVPEELVGIQAYLRWERRGKQNYSPQQEKAEYEEARKELQIEVAQGVSIDNIRARLQGGQVEEKKQESSGNGNAKSDNGGSQSRLSRVPSMSRLSRGKRSPDDLFNRFTPGAKAGAGTPARPRELTPLQKAAQKLEAVDGSEVILKKFFKAGNDDLLVLVTKAEGKVLVQFGTNFKEPLTMRWAVSKDHAREWAPPPETVMPAESILQGEIVDTQFKGGFAGDDSLQVLLFRYYTLISSSGSCAAFLFCLFHFNSTNLCDWFE